MSQLKDPFRRSRTKMFGETIAIGDSNRVTVLDKFDFQSCTISINCSARELVVNNCTFQDCLIGAKKAQADHQFFTSTFERCKFVGDFWGANSDSAMPCMEEPAARSAIAICQRPGSTWFRSTIAMLAH